MELWLLPDVHYRRGCYRMVTIKLLACNSPLILINGMFALLIDGIPQAFEWKISPTQPLKREKGKRPMNQSPVLTPHPAYSVSMAS